MSSPAHAAAAALSGLIFALGLGISGMTRPDKVLGFLELSEGWDPSLAFVMAGGMGLHFVLQRFILRRPSPLLEEHFVLPTRQDITPRLIGGSALFGIGWGIAGYCPGPGVVSLASGTVGPALFVGGMVLGMSLFHLLDRARTRRLARTPGPIRALQSDPGPTR